MCVVWVNKKQQWESAQSSCLIRPALSKLLYIHYHWFLLTFGFCLLSWYCSKSSLQSDGVRALHLLTWSVQNAFSFRPPGRKINWWYGSVVGPPTERCRYPRRLRTLIFINHACVVHMRTHAQKPRLAPTNGALIYVALQQVLALAASLWYVLHRATFANLSEHVGGFNIENLYSVAVYILYRVLFRITFFVKPSFGPSKDPSAISNFIMSSPIAQ